MPKSKPPRKCCARRRRFPAEGLFSTIVLNEPPKSEVLAFKPGAPMTRQAFSIVLDRRGNKTFEAVVDLDAKSRCCRGPK